MVTGVSQSSMVNVVCFGDGYCFESVVFVSKVDQIYYRWSAVYSPFQDNLRNCHSWQINIEYGIDHSRIIHEVRHTFKVVFYRLLKSRSIF